MIGEAEGAIEKALNSLDNNDFGRVISGSDRADMTQSPPPRWDLLNMESYLSLPVQFCRGCPFHCEFCDVTVMMGKAVRAKTPQQILDELQKPFDLGWRGEVAFVDDNIIGNIKRIKELCRVIIPWMRRHGYPLEFQTQTSLNLAFKQDLLDCLVEAGFTKTCVGIEALSQETLKETKKYQNMRVDQEESLRKIGRAGIRVKCTVIIGFDTEPSRVDKESLPLPNARGSRTCFSIRSLPIRARIYGSGSSARADCSPTPTRISARSPACRTSCRSARSTRLPES